MKNKLLEKENRMLRGRGREGSGVAEVSKFSRFARVVVARKAFFSFLGQSLLSSARVRCGSRFPGFQRHLSTTGATGSIWAVRTHNVR